MLLERKNYLFHQPILIVLPLINIYQWSKGMSKCLKQQDQFSCFISDFYMNKISYLKIFYGVNSNIFPYEYDYIF